MQENIRKIEDETFFESPPENKGLRFLISLGRNNGISLQEYDDLKLLIHIAQTYDRGNNSSLKGKKDIMRTVEKLISIEDEKKLIFPSSHETKKGNKEELMIMLKKENNELKQQLFQRDKIIEELSEIQREKDRRIQELEMKIEVHLK